jgi:DNA-3-methyladenine glycosylase
MGRRGPAVRRRASGPLFEVPRNLTGAAAAIVPAALHGQPTLRVARVLLGKILVHSGRDGLTAGRIVEVEAYCGPADRAAHSSGGRRTARNEVMWGPPGHLYVYFTYGMHYCCNVVTRAAGKPEAVLLRALEPIAGLDLMRRRRARGHLQDHLLCRGPGNLCRAMAIDRRLNGADLLRGPVRIVDAPRIPAARIAASPRIGVAYAGGDAELPWRFYLRDSPAVSGRTASSGLHPRLA